MVFLSGGLFAYWQMAGGRTLDKRKEVRYMSVDLNELARKLQSQRNCGVTKQGEILPVDPRNDGSRVDADNVTTLEPKRFFVS